MRNIYLNFMRIEHVNISLLRSSDKLFHGVLLAYRPEGALNKQINLGE